MLTYIYICTIQYTYTIHVYYNKILCVCVCMYYYCGKERQWRPRANIQVLANTRVSCVLLCMCLCVCVSRKRKQIYFTWVFPFRSNFSRTCLFILYIVFFFNLDNSNNVLTYIRILYIIHNTWWIVCRRTRETFEWTRVGIVIIIICNIFNTVRGSYIIWYAFISFTNIKLKIIPVDSDRL